MQCKSDNMKIVSKYFFECRKCNKIISTITVANIKQRTTGLCFKCSHQGEYNPNWGGDKVGYHGIHSWVKRHKPKPFVCEICKQKEPFDMANVSGKYKRDINDFQWLCRSCHMKLDKRLEKLHENNRR